nr:E102 [uncultured bacterium]ART38444.1 G398 [uncultured bacterium]
MDAIPIMTDAAIALLTTRGMNESDMLYDKFVTKADTGG